MTFSNNIMMESLEETYIIEDFQDFKKNNDEYNSLLWEEIRKVGKRRSLIKVPARALKPGTCFYSKTGKYLGYRVQ